jgi:hypothetical protein
MFLKELSCNKDLVSYHAFCSMKFEAFFLTWCNSHSEDRTSHASGDHKLGLTYWSMTNSALWRLTRICHTALGTIICKTLRCSMCWITVDHLFERTIDPIRILWWVKGKIFSLVTITEVLSTLPWPGYLVLTMNKAERVILNLDSLGYDDQPTLDTNKICSEVVECKCSCLMQHPPSQVRLYPIVPSTMMITSLVWTWPKSMPHQFILNIVV